jgi:hypothetical protein
MKERKGTGGRPRGARYPAKGFFYGSDEDLRLLAVLAERWDLSESATVRRLIREEATRQSVAGRAE